MNAFLLRTKECKSLAKEKECGNFFNDGVRRIDVILAYDEDEDSEGWLRSYRDAYIKNLHSWRLQIEIDVFVRVVYSLKLIFYGCRNFLYCLLVCFVIVTFLFA